MASKLWKIGFPPESNFRHPDGQVMIVLRQGISDCVFLIPSAPFKESVAWAPRFTESWRQQDRSDIYATINCGATEKRALRLVLAYHEDEDSHSLEAGLNPAKDCFVLRNCPHDQVIDERLRAFETHVSTGATCYQFGKHFYVSKHSSGFVQLEAGNTLQCGCHRHVISVIAHKVLLVYLLNLYVDTSQEEPWRVFMVFANVIALAEMYDFLKLIAASVSRDLRQVPNLWTEVATHPQFFLAVSVKLKDRPLFDEAFRHTIGTTKVGQKLEVFKAISDTSGLEPQDVEHLLTKYRLKLESTIQMIEKIVTRHCLPSSYAKLLGDPSNVTFSSERSQAELYKSLFRWTFKEWFDNQWMAARLATDRYPVVQKLVFAKSYKAGDKDSILGENFHEKLASSFLPARQKPEDFVRDPQSFLCSYMQQFFSKLSQDLSECLNKFNKSRIAGDVEHFTHFKFDERDLPWLDVSPKEKEDNSIDRSILEAAGVGKECG